jgi:type I restriction enzyme S subunit
MSEGNGLPNGWAEATIGDLVQPKVSQEGADKGVSFIYVDISGVNNESKKIEDPRTLPCAEAPSRARQRLEEGDVLVSMTRPNLNAVAIVPASLDGAIGSTGFDVLRPIEVAPGLLFYAVQTNGFIHAMCELVQGALYPAVRPKDIRAHRLPLPPLPEQHRIVEKIEELFSDLDVGVSALERAKANLKRYRASVLKSAVEGRLTEEWRKEHPQGEDGQMLLDRILRERRDKWEKDQLAQFKKKGKEPPKNWQSKYEEPSAPDTSHLPKLPEGWVWATMPQLGVLDRGRSRHRPRNAKHLYGGKYPFIQTGDIRHANTFVRTYTQTYSDAGLAQSRLWPAGTLCITIAANIAETAILTFDACFPDSVVGFLPADDSVSARFLEAFLCTVQKYLEAYAPATAQKNINLETLSEVAVPLPPPAEQEQIVALVEERLSQIDSAEKTIDAELIRSKRLRQSILKRAFEGQLVPQDPKDEPASVLLERIKATREQEQPKKKAKKVKAK